MALNLDEIRAIADRVAASHGLDIVEIEAAGSSKDRTLRIFIEKTAAERAKLATKAGEHPEEFELPQTLFAGGMQVDQLAFVTHEDCERFSKDFGTVLEVEEPTAGLREEYTLEVSSPGLDRKLYGRGDYERFRGSLVKLQTTEPVQGNRYWQGRIAGVEQDAVSLDPGGAKQKGKARKAGAAASTVEIAFANIAKANLVPEI